MPSSPKMLTFLFLHDSSSEASLKLKAPKTSSSLSPFFTGESKPVPNIILGLKAKLFEKSVTKESFLEV